jgi:flagellar M-ring protein FliF
VNYRRALEGEIARTIATLAEVSGARVHISMAKDSLFGERRPAKASVVLKLRNNRPLAAPTVSGITNLVAASVEGLRPESVVVLAARSPARRKTGTIRSARRRSSGSSGSSAKWPAASWRCSSRSSGPTACA